MVDRGLEGIQLLRDRAVLAGQSLGEFPERFGRGGLQAVPIGAVDLRRGRGGVVAAAFGEAVQFGLERSKLDLALHEAWKDGHDDRIVELADGYDGAAQA